MQVEKHINSPQPQVLLEGTYPWVDISYVLICWLYWSSWVAYIFLQLAAESDMGLANAFINGDISVIDKNEGLMNFFMVKLGISLWLI